MKTKTKLKLYKLCYSEIPEYSLFFGAGGGILASIFGLMPAGMPMMSIIVPSTIAIGSIFAGDQWLSSRGKKKVNIGDGAINRDNIRRLISSYFFLLAGKNNGEENSLQKLFLPDGNQNNIEVYQKFFLKNMSLRKNGRDGDTEGGVLTKNEISEIEKTYPGLFKEVLEEFIDVGIVEHILFKTEHQYSIEKTKSDFIIRAMQEFYPEYKIDHTKINNFNSIKNTKKISAEKLRKFLPFIDRDNSDLIRLIIKNSEDSAIELIKQDAQKLKSQEIIEGASIGATNKKKEEKTAKQTSQKEKISILLGAIGDRELAEKFNNLAETYNKVSKKIVAVEGGEDIQNLEKVIWVNNVYKKIYPSISAYADLVGIGADDEKSKEIIEKAKLSINSQMDILSKHLGEIEQVFKEETISEKLKRIKVQEIITAKTLTR